MYYPGNFITVNKLRTRLAGNVEGRGKNAYKIFSCKKLKGGEYPRRLPTCTMQEDTEWKKQTFKIHGINSRGSGHGPVTAPYKYGNFPSDSVRTGNFLEQLN
jgi:hypothetical protein